MCPAFFHKSYHVSPARGGLGRSKTHHPAHDATTPTVHARAVLQRVRLVGSSGQVRIKIAVAGVHNDTVNKRLRVKRTPPSMNLQLVVACIFASQPVERGTDQVPDSRRHKVHDLLLFDELLDICLFIHPLVWALRELTR